MSLTATSIWSYASVHDRLAVCFRPPLAPSSLKHTVPLDKFHRIVVLNIITVDVTVTTHQQLVWKFGKSSDSLSLSLPRSPLSLSLSLSFSLSNFVCLIINEPLQLVGGKFKAAGQHSRSPPRRYFEGDSKILIFQDALRFQKMIFRTVLRFPDSSEIIRNVFKVFKKQIL